MKKSVLLPRAGIAFLALVGATVILSAVTIVLTSLGLYAQGPEDLLPARETLAVLFHPQQASVERFGLWLPALAHVADADASQVIAVVEVPGGKGTGAVAFTRRTAERKTQDIPNALIRQAGAFSVTVSTPELWPLLADDGERLADARTFRALAHGKDANASWIYCTARVLPPPSSLIDRLVSSFFLSNVSAFAFSTNERNDSVIDLASENSPWDQQAAMPVPPLQKNTFFSVSLVRPLTLHSALMNGLSKQQHVIAESWERTQVQKFFGQDVSPESDLAPLFGKELTLSLAHTATGGTAFLLQGKTESDPLPLLQRIHDSVRAGFPASRIVTRVLDKGRFISRNLQPDIAIAQEEQEEGPWHVRSTRTADGKGIFSAVNGADVLLSNDRSLLEEAGSSTGSMLPENVHAAGFLLLKDVPVLPGLLSPSAPLLSPETTRLHWSLVHRKDLTTVILRTEK